MWFHLTADTGVYNVEDDEPSLVCQAHVIFFHLTQETRVYNVEDDVAGIICQALQPGELRL
jgi:hypothetical protein